jgi:hypothetical protein
MPQGNLARSNKEGINIGESVFTSFVAAVLTDERR